MSNIDVNAGNWWPESPGEIFVARLTSNLNPPSGSDTTLGYVVVRRTIVPSLNVVISAYGSGGVYPSLDRAENYRNALADVIASSEYRKYQAKSRKIFEDYRIG